MLEQLKELPPRTRRILIRGDSDENELGTTSAHAENTNPPHLKPSNKRNYLRARGEYSLVQSLKLFLLELPPRTRRIPEFEDSEKYDFGTTSAHAENTFPHLRMQHAPRNYLRARGEYTVFLSMAKNLWELPPRTRRIP